MKRQGAMTKMSGNGVGMLTRSLAMMSLLAAPALAGTVKVETDKVIGLENELVSASFHKDSGALVSLRNLATNDEYLKDVGGGGNVFRVYLEPKELPPIVEASFPWNARALREKDDLGGELVDCRHCRLVSESFVREDRGGRLDLSMRHDDSGMEFKVSVILPDDSDAADFGFEIVNAGDRERTFLAAFPYFTGFGLGEDRSSNLTVHTDKSGMPGMPAWVDKFKQHGRESGGIYGRHLTMQMVSIYEPSLNEGFGIIVMDAEPRSKVIHQFEPSGVSVLYFPFDKLRAGESLSYPSARIMVHEGNWRRVAKGYGEWFSSAFNIRKPGDWYYEDVDLYSGWWVPGVKAVAESKERLAANIKDAGPQKNALYRDRSPEEPWPAIYPPKPRPEYFTSFEDIPLLYLGNQTDLIEWAMYWQGMVNTGTRGADGTYHFRSDLGGAVAMRKGVERLHKIGRRIMFYVASISVRKDSDIFKETNIEDWLLMEKPDGSTGRSYPEGVAMCYGYEPWQDHVAEVCRRILWETGADGIRLDEFGGPSYTCYNPAHHHESPYDGVKWGMEFLRKIRAAMDEINPDAILMAEHHCDMTSVYVDGGGLQMFYPGKGEIDALRVAVPANMLGPGYHPGQFETALNGYPANRVSAFRRQFPHDVRPAGYPDENGPNVRWHELRSTFHEAQYEGMVTDVDPFAVDDANWVGRIWCGADYWVMIGGREDLSALDGGAKIRLPELPSSVKSAYEFDVETLAMREAQLVRNDEGIFVTVTSPFSAVLLPTPECKPLVFVDGDLPSPSAGEEAEIRLTAFSPWSSSSKQRVRVEMPGMEVENTEIVLPGSVSVKVPLDILPGNYYIKVKGDCLALKRWFSVKK